MTDLNKAELRRLAEAANPGPWCVENGIDQVRDDADDFVCDTGEDEPVNASFIAAANPAAILSLLDELENCRISWGLLNAERAQLRARVTQLESEAIYTAAGVSSDRQEIDQLRAKVEALRKDAERWRFVRSPIGTKSTLAVWQEGRMPLFSAVADAVADEAMAKEGGANG